MDSVARDREPLWVETLFSNIDGFVNGADAFRIDAVGANTPLIFESGVADGIWSAGEIWHFVIQDYTNIFGDPPSAFTSPGVPSPAGAGGSSGSIIAVTPEPSTALLLLPGLAALAWRRRRAR